MGASVSVAQGAPLDAGTYKADEAAVERFCELLRIPTVSRENIAERDTFFDDGGHLQPMPAPRRSNVSNSRTTICKVPSAI